MFPVEIHLCERDEEALTARMTAMREWLDHRRFEPSTFRYTFTGPDGFTAAGILFEMDFSVEAEALAFASEFGGRLTGALANMSYQEAEPQAATD
jgi:hypothetical protein